MFKRILNEDKKPRARVIILGSSGVGKTSLRQRYIKGSFRSQLMTIGVELSSQDVVLDDDEITLEIIDIAGQDSFEMQKRVLKNIQGAIIVFDITQPESFFSLRSWLDKIYQYNPKTKAPVIIVGNKSDLNAKRSIPESDAIKLVETLESEKDIYAKHIKFVETSAKTGSNIDLVFNTLATYILDCFY